MLRQRRLPARAGDAHVRSRRARWASRSRRAGGRDRRQHARAHALRRATAPAYTPAAAHDLPDVAQRQGLPRRDDADATRPAQAAGLAGCSCARSQEHADAALGRLDRTTRRPRRARRRRAVAALSASRRCRSWRAPAASMNGLVHDQELIDRRLRVRRHVRRRDARCSGRRPRLRAARITCRGASRAGGATSRVTLCGDRRGRTPMHTVAVGGRDAEARAALEAAGSQRAAGEERLASWRYESCFTDYDELDGRRLPDPVRDAGVRPMRRPARRRQNGRVQHAAVHAGRLGPAGHGDVRRGRRATTSSSRSSAVSLDRPVYDLDVEGTHNFVAERTRDPQLGLRLPWRGHHEHPRLRGRRSPTPTS